MCLILLCSGVVSRLALLESCQRILSASRGCTPSLSSRWLPPWGVRECPQVQLQIFRPRIGFLLCPTAQPFPSPNTHPLQSRCHPPVLPLSSFSPISALGITIHPAAQAGITSLPLLSLTSHGRAPFKVIHSSPSMSWSAAGPGTVSDTGNPEGEQDRLFRSFAAYIGPSFALCPLLCPSLPWLSLLHTWAAAPASSAASASPATSPPSCHPHTRTSFPFKMQICVTPSLEVSPFPSTQDSTG